jgi:hypothetical protein
MHRPEQLLRRLQDWRRKNSHSGRGFDNNRADAFSLGSDLALLATFVVPALGILGAIVFGWPF